jgi:hypothetical protein
MARCVRGVRMLWVGEINHSRLPELVSGFIVPNKPPVAADKWTLKQVQGDGAGFDGDGLGFAR